MRVAPGQQIPFWFRLWDGRADRFVIAHVTANDGTEQPDSPFLLSYVQRGIYTGLGPIMETTPLNIDYETYVDVDLTQLDLSYLPAVEQAEVDIAGNGTGILSEALVLFGQSTTAILSGQDTSAVLEAQP